MSAREFGFDFGFTFNPAACKGCGGRCCVGESGYIFLSIREAESIARFLGMEFESFALRYMRKVGYRFSLIEKPMKTSRAESNAESSLACVFFDERSGGCGIYECRPSQCVSFPFWESLRECDDRALQELCALCPGVTRKNAGSLAESSTTSKSTKAPISNAPATTHACKNTKTLP